MQRLSATPKAGGAAEQRSCSYGSVAEVKGARSRRATAFTGVAPPLQSHGAVAAQRGPVNSGWREAKQTASAAQRSRVRCRHAPDRQPRNAEMSYGNAACSRRWQGAPNPARSAQTVRRSRPLVQSPRSNIAPSRGRYSRPEGSARRQGAVGQPATVAPRH